MHDSNNSQEERGEEEGGKDRRRMEWIGVSFIMFLHDPYLSCQ